MKNYNEMEVAGGVPVKMWTQGVPVEDEARKEVERAASILKARAKLAERKPAGDEP